MAYINNEKIEKIRNALAIILQASFDAKHQDRLEDIVRQVGRISKLLLVTDQSGLRKGD